MGRLWCSPVHCEEASQVVGWQLRNLLSCSRQPSQPRHGLLLQARRGSSATRPFRRARSARAARRPRRHLDAFVLLRSATLCKFFGGESPWATRHLRVNPSVCVVLLEDGHPKHLQSSANLNKTKASTWLRGRRAARADRACRMRRAAALPLRACSWRSRRVAETIGGNTASSSPTAIGRPGWPPRSVQVSNTTFPCALH